MSITLVPINRTNWRDAIDVKLRPDQARFVASPLFSLAAAWVRRWGDNYIYAPTAICRDGAVIGYVCTVCDPESANGYWIDDILIDARHQARGYGRIAVREVIASMLQTYENCTAVKLHCHPENKFASGLYMNMGFRPTGTIDPSNGNHEYELSGDALRSYARKQ